MRRTLFGLAVVLALAAPALYAHHSFSADYHEDQRISLEGSVEEFLYRNPHAFLKVRVMQDGQPVSYLAEWAGAGRLERQGVTPETLRAGDVVRISGSPGRNERDRRIHLKSIQRPADGWEWSGRRR